MNGLLTELSTGATNANTPAQWAVVALGVLTIIYVAVIRPMRKGKSKRDPLERFPRQASLAQQRAVERDMSNLLVEYEEMIRRMTAQVDTRATRLDLLIREAEEKIAQLNALLKASSGNGSAAVAPPGEAPAPPAAPPVSGDSDAPAAADGGDGAAPAPADAAGKSEGRHAAIYRLADSGRSAYQIAQELSRPQGEVELILHLRSPRQRQPGLWAPPAGKPAPDSVSAHPDSIMPEAQVAPEPAEQRRKGRKKRDPGTLGQPGKAGFTAE